jgi:hypothetical protein
MATAECGKHWVFVEFLRFRSGEIEVSFLDISTL